MVRGNCLQESQWRKEGYKKKGRENEDIPSSHEDNDHGDFFYQLLW